MLANRALGPHHPLAKQIARDRESLERVMRQLSVAPSAIKVGMVRVAARRSPRSSMAGCSSAHLSSVIELETPSSAFAARGIFLDSASESGRKPQRRPRLPYQLLELKGPN